MTRALHGDVTKWATKPGDQTTKWPEVPEVTLLSYVTDLLSDQSSSVRWVTELFTKWPEQLELHGDVTTKCELLT